MTLWVHQLLVIMGGTPHTVAQRTPQIHWILHRHIYKCGRAHVRRYESWINRTNKKTKRVIRKSLHPSHVLDELTRRINHGNVDLVHFSRNVWRRMLIRNYYATPEIIRYREIWDWPLKLWRLNQLLFPCCRKEEDLRLCILFWYSTPSWVVVCKHGKFREDIWWFTSRVGQWISIQFDVLGLMDNYPYKIQAMSFGRCQVSL
jgi:hypothetical protein